MLLVLCAKSGIPALAAAKILSVLLGALVLWLVYRMALLVNDDRVHAGTVALAATLLLALNPVFMYWTTGGLETMLYAAATAGALCLLVVGVNSVMTGDDDGYGRDIA